MVGRLVWWDYCTYLDSMRRIQKLLLLLVIPGYMTYISLNYFQSSKVLDVSSTLRHYKELYTLNRKSNDTNDHSKEAKEIKEDEEIRTNKEINEDKEIKEVEEQSWKTILFWNSWFGTDWRNVFAFSTEESLKESGCPSWRCKLTTDRSDISNADAVVFNSNDFYKNRHPKYRTPNQRWVWIIMEAPTEDYSEGLERPLRVENTSHLVNWTMTYHTASDIVKSYGHLVPKSGNVPVRSNLISSYNETMREYMKFRQNNGSLADVMGSSWRLFVRRPQLVAWMSSHCKTNSRREDYIRELEKYINVTKYGTCGNNICFPKHPTLSCWDTTLGYNHLFYLSFENNLCNEYISEKFYLALINNLVPIVYGGADYDRFLPYGSYINARHYHPKELAALLLRLQKDPEAYGRYHIWRKFFEVHYKASLCELCHKLHSDNTVKYYENISKWRLDTNECSNPKENLFTNKAKPDAWKQFINPQKARQ